MYTSKSIKKNAKSSLSEPPVIQMNSGVKVQKIWRGLKMKIRCIEGSGVFYKLNFNCSCLQKIAYFKNTCSLLKSEEHA